MRLQPLSFHIAAGLALPLLAPLPAHAQSGTYGQAPGPAPHYTAKDAVRVEWMRTPPALSAEQIAKLPTADRARLELSLKRIGRPGAWELLPTELAHPTQGQWDQKAEEARTPRERFDALFFLNRLKEKDALKALNGLKPEDARTWPKHLHLEAQVATARLNGGEVSAELQAFLDALQKAGKVDPVRAQAARLRLVMAGKEKQLLPEIKATPGAVLALADSWNRGDWEKRSPALNKLFNDCEPGIDLSEFGLAPIQEMSLGLRQRLFQTFPESGFTPANTSQAQLLDLTLSSAGEHCSEVSSQTHRLDRLAALEALARLSAVPDAKILAQALPLLDSDPISRAALLPSLRKLNPESADKLRSEMLSSPLSSPISRAAAIEDLPAPPADLDTLTKRTWADDQFESQQTLIQSYTRWKMAPEEQKAQLNPWLQHPNWSCRFEAYQALKKLDPATTWPEAPQPTATEEKILKEAERLAQAGRPVRLRITFSGHRQVTMKLDPTVAPINVANLELLAKKRFFDGHLVPRVVPDFVVQMGSPFDTMDGGPGYTVRCEDSLNWYGPGSVGMALAGKDTGGCQFFITTNATPHLTGKYTRVGEVEDLDHAMKILDDLELGAKIESIRVVQ